LWNLTSVTVIRVYTHLSVFPYRAERGSAFYHTKRPGMGGLQVVTPCYDVLNTTQNTAT